MSYQKGKAYFVTMSPADIRKEVARAMMEQTAVTLYVIGDDDTTEIQFEIGSTNHTSEDRTLDIVLGTTREGKRVQVTILTESGALLKFLPEMN